MRVAQTGLDILRSRLQLAGLELLKEEKRLSILGLQVLWVMFSVVLVVQGGLILAWTLVSEESRWILFSGILGLSVLAMIAGLWGIHAQISKKPSPLSATVQELERDVECLKSALK